MLQIDVLHLSKNLLTSKISKATQQKQNGFHLTCAWYFAVRILFKCHYVRIRLNPFNFPENLSLDFHFDSVPFWVRFRLAENFALNSKMYSKLYSAAARHPMNPIAQENIHILESDRERMCIIQKTPEESWEGRMRDTDRQSLKYRCQINNNGAKAVMQYSIDS